MNYKIGIMGSTGFIGGHLKKYLTDLGYDVCGIKNDEYMIKDNSKENIVVNCGWIRNNDLDSQEHLECATEMCKKMETYKQFGIRVINLGSSSEYGVKYEKMKEDMICEPINTYGIAKLMVTLYAKRLGFNTLRLFTVTGEGGHSFADIMDKTEKWESPRSMRNFVKVKVVCKAIERLLHANHLYGEIINIADLGAVRYGIIDHDNIKNRWYKYPQRQYEPQRWEADITKMERLLNI